MYSGHDHTYERCDVAGVRHADVHGLVFVTVTPSEFVSRFFDSRGVELDAIRLQKP